jgi:DNA-directed RNA polymerase specialized sigma24 family protein
MTKDALQNELYCGEEPAIRLLYTRYGGMLYGYVLQFVPDKLKAEDLLVTIFSRLAFRLQEACDSSLSIYCWLQVEAREILLKYFLENKNGHAVPSEPEPFNAASGQSIIPYFSLLEDASPEHQRVFRKLFLHGIGKEDLALQTGKDLAYIDRLLRESLLIIRKRLG